VGGVLETRAGVGGEQEGGQIDGEQGEHKPDQFHGCSRFFDWFYQPDTSTVNLLFNPLYFTILDLSIQFIDTGG
jgi:hypothetical protein